MGPASVKRKSPAWKSTGLQVDPLRHYKSPASPAVSELGFRDIGKSICPLTITASGLNLRLVRHGLTGGPKVRSVIIRPAGRSPRVGSIRSKLKPCSVRGFFAGTTGL